MQLFAILLVFVIASVGLVWFLLARDRGEREPISALWIALGLGFVGAIGAIQLEGRLINDDDLLPGASLGTMFMATLLVGLIEEFCKFVPLALFIAKKRYFNEHTDGIIYFALAGLGFGLPENVLYTVQYGTETGMARLFLTPLFHAAITGVVGYFFVRRKMSGRSLWAVTIPLLGASFVHALYNFGLMSGVAIFVVLSLVIALSLTAALFALYVRASELDQDRGLSAVGHNSFCRSCGSANTHHHLYCTHCGHHA